VLGFSVNGSNVGLQLIYSNSTISPYYVSNNGSYTYNLNAGDIVTIRLFTNADASYTIEGTEYWTTFCGHLVYAY
jgi:hypothetical protein